jgi:hypothetical protein
MTGDRPVAEVETEKIFIDVVGLEGAELVKEQTAVVTASRRRWITFARVSRKITR